MHNKIKSKEYERLDEKTKDKLINQESVKVSDFIKNPILIKNSYNYIEITEKILKKDNEFVMEYCSDDRVFRTTYILN